MFPKDELRISKENFLILQPVLICSRAFGLCPVRYKNCGHYFTLEWSYGYAVFSFVIPTIFASITLYSLLEDNMSQDEEKSNDRKRYYLNGCDIGTVIFIVLFGIISTPKKTKAIWKICNNFSEIEENIIIKNPRRHRIISIVFITCVLFAYCIVYILDLLAWHTSFEEIDGIFQLFVDYVPYYILKFIMLNQILLFCHMAYFTKLRLLVLNKSVQEITKEKIFELSNFKNGEIRVLPPNCTNDIQINNTASRVLRLIKVHRKLFETIGIIDQTKEFGIVVIMFCIMLHLIVTPYFLFTEIAKGHYSNKVFIALQVMWVFAHAGKLLIILESCNQCVTEAEETLIIVQRLFVQETVERTKKALQYFMMQLINCPIEINIIGLFKLDRSILTGFVASITTYLVVLIQLK